MTQSAQAAGVAGLFYPADPGELAGGVDASLAKAAPQSFAPKAVIAPHAGHIYSGDIAGTAYRLLAKRKGDIKRVVLFGPNHRAPVRGMALSPADAWQTPLGPLRVDGALRDALARRPGVSVAAEPFVREHSLEVHLPFIHRALGGVEILPVLVGQSPAGQVCELLETLWGGPETAIVVSSDLSHFHDYDTCRTKDAETAAGIERLQDEVCRTDRACGHFAIAGLLDQARRRDLRVTALDVRNSGDTHGRNHRERVVGYGAFAFEYAHAARLEAGERQVLIGLARDVVRQSAMNGGKEPEIRLGQLPPALLAQRATFVTLKIGGQLRGCVGSLVPHRPLVADVAANAWKSGFADRRFAPLSAEELEGLDFSVSILSTPRRIACSNEAALLAALKPDIDGLIIRDGGHQALFLPSVWESLDDPRSFLMHLKRKAGLPPDHWSPGFEAWRFTTESFGDEKNKAVLN
ncbi:MAG TPA: AmmeMemoRadiSam system protein B [Rhizomicrobium sp.]|nr:AmmeMemoRadiSam system protein B [Rhizomicrobium sp.]